MTGPAGTDLWAEALALGTATLHEAADRTGALRPEIRRIGPGMALSGPALTIRCPPGDNLWIHRAILAASAGDILVVATGDSQAMWGYWGEILAVAAVEAGLGGLVLQGGSRDHDALVNLGFPVFSLGACVRGTVKDKAPGIGSVGEPVLVGGIVVRSGDLVVGDADGVVTISQERASEVIALGRERVDKERRVMEALRRGATTVELYDLS